MQIQISWLLQKPTDLGLHCLQRQGYPGSAEQRLSGSCLVFDHLVGEEGAEFFAFLWFVNCVLSVLVCFLFLFVSLGGYDL